MREFPAVRRVVAPADWQRRALRIACVILVGAVLAACDRCGDWAVPGTTTSCRQEAPKPH